MSHEHRSICVVALALALLSAPLSAQGTLHVFSGYDGAVAPAGDVDLDGHPDALLAKAPQPSAIGRVAIVSGASGAPLVLVNGPVPGDGFGHAIAGARDLSSDGQPDFVVGAPDGVPALGAPPYVRACLSSSPTLWTAYGPPGSRFGSALALDADLDGDGVADLLVGAPDEGPAQAGAVHVLSGASGATIRVHPAQASSVGEFGFAVAFVGDVDQDGVSDYALGDPGADLAAVGRVDLHAGASGALLYSVGSGAPGAFGYALAGVGDLDADAVPDFVVGAPGEAVMSLTSGSTALFSGASGALVRATTALPGTLMFGKSVTALGDYDGDGTPDYAAHYPAGWVGGVVKNIGSARVLSGATGSDLAALSSGMMGPIAGAGDVNLDSVPDLLVGGGAATPGYAALILGKCEAPLTYCTAKTNSLGCVPNTSWTGASSASIGPDLTVLAASVQGAKPGLLLWSLGPDGTPFGGGYLCIASPLRRTTAVTSSGSSSNCDGALAWTFTKSYLAAQGLGAGVEVFTQFWMRDPGFAGANAIGLTRGLRFTVWP